MGTINVFLGPSATSQNSADYTLSGWDKDGSALTLTSWSWTETGNGGYVVSHANLVPGCTYWLRKTAGGTPWSQGEIAMANGGTNVTYVAGAATTATLDSLSSQISAIGSGTGAALNFEVNDDNTGTTGDTVLDSVTQVGTATGGTTFANTQADNNVYHTIASATNQIDWVYKFACGGGRNASKIVLRAFMTAVGDTVTVQAYDHVGTDWETIGSITGTTETLYDLPLYVKHTGTGALAGNVYIRFIFNEGDAGELNIDLAYVQAQNLGQTTGYADGSLWVKATGTAGTTPYVNGTADNPAPWASIKTLNTTLGFGRYVVSPGTTITLDAALTASVMRGRGYGLALGGQNISGSYFEGVESLSGIGTTATAEAIFVDCHVAGVTLGEFDMVRCHLHGTLNLSAASKYYRMHNCTGIENAVVEFAAATQTLALSEMSGAITITGMTAGDTLLVDGNGVLTLGATCDGGTVHISGNIELTNSGSGQTITYGATTVGPVTLADGAHGGASASILLGDTDVETALDSASAPSAADVADAVWNELVSDHAGVGSTGAALAAAGGSGDPWATALPGAYGAGTAGQIIGDRIVVLGNEAHGGAAATFETAAGVLAQESAAGTIETSFAQNIGRWNALAQPAMEVYLPVKGWDWTSDPIISVTYDGALSVGDGIWLDLRWWRSTDATLQSVELGNLANDGTTWTPDAGLAAALAAIAPALMCNDVSCTIGAWTRSGQQIGAGTLTINFNAAVGGATGSVALEILDVTQDACHIYWDRYGRCLCNPALRENIEADWVNGGRLDLLLDTAAAGGGGTGSPSGAAFFTTED